MIDIKTASLKDIEAEYEECCRLWSSYSCDCLGFYMNALTNRMYELKQHKNT